MQETRATVAWLLLLLLGLTVLDHAQSRAAVDRCHTLPSTLRMKKQVVNEEGKHIKTCVDTVAVSKCEGNCRSQESPSVMATSGFLKSCRCCREEQLSEKVVRLRNCYIPITGELIKSPLEVATHDVVIYEPTGCKCFRCLS
ncbi:PREDICTED: partner of bursicon-like [Priapulus caudatus]|uniref:Partner of bursicon-like n=1 Tax=Priapulus caudatus TaxID=37621 RepID=A0ABM1EW26_PRICU|nr:PREDICTED: partner of bursicon-like [Priapulus caudatus]XP_014676397.1 PREDICTED: partner of bursicon-like [Priapulus caudatus]